MNAHNTVRLYFTENIALEKTQKIVSYAKLANFKCIYSSKIGPVLSMEKRFCACRDANVFIYSHRNVFSFLQRIICINEYNAFTKLLTLTLERVLTDVSLQWKTEDI